MYAFEKPGGMSFLTIIWFNKLDSFEFYFKIVVVFEMKRDTIQDNRHRK